MNQPRLPLAALAWICSAALALPGAAGASSFASSASDSLTTSVGSASDSLRKSSDASSGPTKVADGDYRILEVADVETRPGFVRLTLHALADAAAAATGDLLLDLPRDTLTRAGLAPGQVVTAHARPYGVEFAQGQPSQPFFLVLADDWHRELQSHPVTL